MKQNEVSAEFTDEESYFYIKVEFSDDFADSVAKLAVCLSEILAEKRAKDKCEKNEVKAF